MPKKIIVFFLLFAFILSSGFGCKTNNQVTKEALEPITLNYWRVFDGQDAFAEIIQKYNAIHPNIKTKLPKITL
jgi:ABC-type glycerol-3-phosphate transport system substrate-binding protein